MPTPSTAEWGMQLLISQRAAGGLTIGDTHVYDEPFDFAVEEHLYDDLRPGPRPSSAGRSPRSSDAGPASTPWRPTTASTTGQP